MNTVVRSQAVRPPSNIVDLVRLAVNDAKMLDRDKYRPSYTTWHRGEYDVYPECEVCFAGAAVDARCPLDAPT